MHWFVVILIMSYEMSELVHSHGNSPADVETSPLNMSQYQNLFGSTEMRRQITELCW